MTTKIIEQRLSELEERVTKLEVAGSVSPVRHAGLGKQKKISAKEFLMTKELRTETQKTLVLGYYLEYMEGMATFNIDDLMVVFRTAKEKHPRNVNDVVNKNVARGLLMEVVEKKNSKKAWVLTSTGEKWVEEEVKKVN